ncbi:MAG: ABC transporter permease subunit, partial [Desulfobacterales bacterium]
MRKLIIPIQFIMVMGCLALNGYAEQPKEKLANSLGMEFVLIKPGKFMMGSPEDEPGRYTGERLHAVNLTNSYYMQTTEVTQAQWKALMGKNPASHKRCGDTCPVEQISWQDAQQFIQKLNQKEGTDKYRLPTEAEWEYASRAGSTTAFPNGGITKLQCDRDDNLDSTPLLAQLYFFYFGLPTMGIMLPEWVTGVIALVLNSGAYYAEIIRAGIQAIPFGQIEAGIASGLSYFQRMRYIILPQALGNTIRPMLGQAIILVK